MSLLYFYVLCHIHFIIFTLQRYTIIPIWKNNLSITPKIGIFAEKSMIQFVNITEAEFLKKKLVYKHMSLENALRTLETRSLWFANPENWKDPFEKRFLNAKYISKGEEVAFNWKDRLFCTCVTQTISSEAFWHTYSQGEIGVEFRIDRAVLLDELKKHSSTYDIFIGKVEYMKTTDIKQELKKIPFNPPISVGVNTNEFASRLFLLKRNAFRYEDELRIILLKQNKTQEKGITLKYNCDNTKLIRRIILDPNLKEYTYKTLKEVFVSKYGLTPITKKDSTIYSRVIKSQLYASPKIATLKID